MTKFDKKAIHNERNDGSSAFVFDLRNSTKVIRIISWDPRLGNHIDFMMNLHEYMYIILYENCDQSEFAMNDTGDGYLCIFWDPSHALTCLKIAIYVREFLDQNLERHNKSLDLTGNSLKLGYGFGLHSGASTIYRTTFTNNNLSIERDFLFGIVANTAARLESFTKNYINHNMLVTGNFKDAFLDQTASDSLKCLFAENSAHALFLGRANIGDGKENDKKGSPGHNLYALETTFIDKFKSEYMQHMKMG